MSELKIDQSWDGRPIGMAEQVRLSLSRYDGGLQVAVDAPFFGDPSPSTPPGRCDRLWEFEVAELFLVGEAQRYLELEFGPYGHYLALQLNGRRQIVNDSLAIDYQASIEGGKWSGLARVPTDLLPAPLCRWNAFAIHGRSDARRYLAAHPLAGAQPDFHQIDRFPELDPAKPLW
jgi:hypothetical protein